MMVRHFLTVSDLTPRELRTCLHLAAAWKRTPRRVKSILAGKTIALIFEKPSVRTRVSFEVAVRQLGGSTIYLGPEDAQLDRREPVKDVARTLSRYVDGIVCRTFSHHHIEELAQFASVPVINGLSDLHHPCQALADLFTIQEHFGRLKGVRLAYVGDGNNVLHSLIEGCAMTGVNAVVSTPSGYRPDAAIWTAAMRRAKARGAVLRWEPNPQRAVQGADVIYTDVWVSMGKEQERRKRLKTFRPYQLNRDLLRRAKPACRIMHCLPAHRGEEITDDVLESSRSLIVEQAENRLHVQKALLLMLLAKRTKR